MPRYSKPRAHFNWTPSELVAIWQLATTLRTDEEMAVERRFPSGAQLLNKLRHKHPEIVKRYEDKMGKSLLPGVVYDRLHKNYYGTTCVNGRSDEHPQRHPNKRKLLKNGQGELALVSKDEMQGMKKQGKKLRVERIPSVPPPSSFTKDELVLLITTAALNDKEDLVLKLAKELPNAGW